MDARPRDRNIAKYPWRVLYVYEGDISANVWHLQEKLTNSVSKY